MFNDLFEKCINEDRTTNKTADYFSWVGSYNGAVKIKGKWIAVKDLNRIDKSDWQRWQGPPSKEIVVALKEKPIKADELFPKRKNI